MKWITEVIEERKNKEQKEFLKNLHLKLMSNVTNDTPRRIRIDLFTPAEKAIHDAIMVVEKSGADVRLTDAVNLLQQAQSKVADYVDNINR